jgi:hypothetical protein
MTLPARRRRASDAVALPVYLTSDYLAVDVPEGQMVGSGFRAYLDEERTDELVGDDGGLVLPGVFLTRVAGVAFHADVLQRPEFAAGRSIEICPEPANPSDRHALSVVGGGSTVGYLPEAVAAKLAPSGTRRGHGIVVREWTVGGVRHGIWILGSMQVSLSLTFRN